MEANEIAAAMSECRMPVSFLLWGRSWLRLWAALTLTCLLAPFAGAEETLDILNRLHEKGITEQDLQSAKSYIKGQFPPELETADALAGLLAELEFHGLDEREINTYYGKIDGATMAVRR